MVDAFIDAALPLAPRIVQSPAARAEVLALIQQIQREAAAREIATRDGATQLTVALSKVHADAANLRKDVEAANQVILSDKGELAKVQQEIDDIHRKIGGQIAAVVVSSVGIITGTVVVLVGALATLPSGASSTSVILAGVGMIVTGAGGLAAAASLLAADNARLASYYEKSIRLNTAVTLVKTVANQVNSMAAASNGLSEAAGALLTEWASIRAGMTSFQEQILRAADDSDAGRITTALEIARTHWRSVTNQTQTMMRRLVDLKPEEVKELPRPQSAAA
jgi:hypothetical protein